VELHEAKVGDVVVLMPEGSLTAARDCQALEQKLRALIESRASQVVVDGEKVGQIGSGAMRVLLLAGHKLGQSGGRLVLCSLSERVRLAFRISGFDNDFTIVSRREAALAKVQESLPAPPVASTAPPKPGKRTAAAEKRERLRVLVAQALSTGFGKAAGTSGAGRNPASLDRIRGLALSLLEGKGGPA
jgi:anti-sigma B factor antagonist